MTICPNEFDGCRVKDTEVHSTVHGEIMHRRWDRIWSFRSFRAPFCETWRLGLLIGALEPSDGRILGAILNTCPQSEATHQKLGMTSDSSPFGNRTNWVIVCTKEIANRHVFAK